MKHVAILLPEFFFAGGVAGTLDLLYVANRLASPQGGPVFKWQLLSETGAPVTSSTGLSLAVHGTFDDVAQADIVLLPGIVYESVPAFERRVMQQQVLLSHLPRLHAAGTVIGASCSGVVLLAEAGLLDGQLATVSWWLASWFRQRYPAVNLQPQALVTEAGNLLCSGATTAYLNLMLRLIERFAGPDLALQCARMMLVDMHRASQAPYATLQQYTGHNDPLVTRCQTWLQENMAQTFRLEALAAAVGASERTLMRRFRHALGDTPLHYLQQMRLFAARRLLETTALGLEHIVEQVGYADVSSFRRLFKRELLCSPGDYRRRFTGLG